MSLCFSLDRHRPIQGSPLLPEGLERLLLNIRRIRKTWQHASDFPSNAWLSSEGWRPPVAISTEDPFLSSLDPKVLTRAAYLAHFFLGTLGIGQDYLGISLSNPSASTPTRIPNSLRFPSKPTGFVRSLRSFLEPCQPSLFSPSFALRALRWCRGLLMTENSCTPDALAYIRSDKYLEKRSDGGNSPSNVSFVDASSTSYWRCENADKSVLDLDCPFQVLNSSSQADLSSPLRVSFVRDIREHPSTRGPCTSPENAHHILPSDGIKGCYPMTRKVVFKPEGYVYLEDKPWASSIVKEKDLTPNRQLGHSSSDPEDNAGSIKREANGNSRAPADGEASRKPQKRQSQSSHYDEGLNGTTKAGKKQRRDSPERDDDDFDDSGRGNGRPNTGKGRKEEEEEEPVKNKFACPFYKNNPHAFRASRTCVGPGWSSVHRVKEHIFRRHMLSDTQCHDCLEEFGGHDALGKHLEAPCRQKPPLVKSHGINKKQEKQLRSRRMYQKSLDEEEKWRAIYKIIFPDEQNIPSPYYEPEVPEFPDYYRQMLIEKLPGIVTKQLIAPGSGLMRHITANVMANQQASTSEFGSKVNGGCNLALPTQVSADPQLVRQIENVVEAAVRKTLSQVDGAKETTIDDFQIPLLNVESPEEESKGPMEMDKQGQFAGPSPLRGDLLQPIGIVGPGLKVETRAQYPTPTSSAYDRSPEFQFGNMERAQVGSTSPLELDLGSIFGEAHLDDTLLHTTGGGSIAELPATTWDSMASNDGVFSGGMYTPIRQNSNSNISIVSGSAGDQNQGIFTNLETQPESYLFESWDFTPQVTSIQSVDSGYGSIAGPTDSSVLENLEFDAWWPKMRDS